MLYSWTVETEELDEEVMLPPKPSIPAQGHVPTRLSGKYIPQMYA